MKNRESKKSENIEVRISFEVKQALCRKAKLEGRTVSDVLRSLVDNYLIAPLPSVATSNRQNVAVFLKTLVQQPKNIFATFVALITTSSIILTPTAGAEEVHLDLKQEISYLTTEDRSSHSTREYKHLITLQSREAIDLNFPSLVEADLHQDIILRLSTSGLSPSQHSSLSDSKNKFDVNVQIIKNIDGREQILINQSITATEGEQANFLTGFEGHAGLPAGISLIFTLSSEEAL
tara:strand:- start:2925 stop:3629 length:705 start_codon:yes stop_codon:yes gene_type:complete